jgi:hypothetical protein
MSSLEARHQELCQGALNRSDNLGIGRGAMPRSTGNGNPGDRSRERHSGIALTDLVETSVAAFRRHPHICNVMTHISRDRWDKIGEALHAILDPHAHHGSLSPLAENIVDLLCAESGVTGRILKPYFRDLLDRILPSELAARQGTHVGCLFMELEKRRAQELEVCAR